MARSFAALRFIALALLLAGCTDSPPSGVAASVEQTAEHAATPDAASRQQHLARLGLPGWHERGSRGRGVKVAILDSGFRGYRSFLGKGLPPAVRTRSFRVDHDVEARDSQHGILCAEVVHAIAPDAELLFATWEPDSPRAFLDAVAWARTEGARVVSCSLIMPGWSDGEGGGPTHQALAALLGSGNGNSDILCFASAGNTAQRHWTGSFSPNRAGWHQWSPGETHNSVTAWGSERVAVELYGPMHAAYDLEVIDRGTGARIGSARLDADPARRGRAIVRFEPAARAAYAVRVRGTSAADERFHLVVLGGNLEHATAQGSIAFPGDGANVYAIGAVDGEGRRIGYSACGPNSPLPKPDFVAPVPFPSQCRDRPFAGTSAAAPQAAGLAAVLLSEMPQAAPAQVIARMRAAALDLGPPGYDCETGYGLIRLPGE
jgi:subtilisin family serine protease